MTSPAFPAWPPTKPFPESVQDTVGDNAPDFPGSAGGREQGKFRPSRTPKLTQVAVVNDDGTAIIGYTMVPFIAEMLDELRAIRIGIEQLLDDETLTEQATKQIEG